jgi:hypothetical protein
MTAGAVADATGVIGQASAERIHFHVSDFEKEKPRVSSV